ncbi:hypothetical protein [Paenibacillus cremeus]|uniref:Uncharacterized protein n=1 Tax=Paenibacillus cremeus TaxID=2163881 RepID=A0A559KCR5_9BACL|nr:hypothetical protein [Paenibacillus cremeus]TVY09889.1 hypothetical protein FPZ49_10985 [Paenibacillus cremeus]
MWFEIEYYGELPSDEELNKFKELEPPASYINMDDDWDLATIMCRALWNYSDESSRDFSPLKYKEAKMIMIETLEKLRNLR